MEPLMHSMDQGDVGTILHFYGAKRSTRDDEVRNVLRNTDGPDSASMVRLRRLDDQNILASFDTQGRARRVYEALKTAYMRGSVLPFKVRYWGVGVEHSMVGGPPSATYNASNSHSSSSSASASASGPVRSFAALAAAIQGPAADTAAATTAYPQLVSKGSGASAWANRVAPRAEAALSSMVASGRMGMPYVVPTPKPTNRRNQFQDAWGDEEDTATLRTSNRDNRLGTTASTRNAVPAAPSQVFSSSSVSVYADEDGFAADDLAAALQASLESSSTNATTHADRHGGTGGYGDDADNWEARADRS